MRLADIDLSNPDLFADGPPHEAFKVLRREAPLFWNGNGGSDGFWALTRYRDIWNVSLDPKTFSNARRGTILRDWNEEEAASNATIMLNMDPPRHTKYRRLVNLGFSPKITNRLEHHMREITNRIIDKIAARGECDFVTDVAAELPLQVIVEMMGVPTEDRHKIFDWSNTMIGFDDPEYGNGSNEAGKVAAAQIYMYAHELATEHRRCPRDDMVSVLLAAEVEARSSPRSTSTPSSSCCSWPATRRRATRSPAACSRSSSIPRNVRDSCAIRRCSPRRWTRWSVGSPP